MDPTRNQTVGALHLCVTLLVLLHHTVLAYCVYGHFNSRHYLRSSTPIVDRQRWIGSDIIQDYNDTYFMAGVAAGAAGIQHRLLRRDGPISRGWTLCGLLAAASFGLLLMMQLAALHHRLPWSAPSWQAAGAILFALCCVLSSKRLPACSSVM